MSSRALRKAQREREEQEQLRKLQVQADQENEEDEASADDGDDAPAAKQSIFAMLNDDEPGQDDDGDDDDDDQGVPVPDDEPPSREDDRHAPAPTPKPSGKRKKKRKKAKAPAASAAQPEDASLDDIDLALKSLSMNPSRSTAADTAATVSDPTVADLCRLLSIDTQHLHASNEMKRLFGRAALESDDADDNNAAGRRRNRGGQLGGLAAAVGRRQGQAGRSTGLAALSLRRNIFIQGKEEWPAATGGGLGMEVVSKNPDGTVEYAYVHNRQYQDVQGQFDSCVASMDPNRMIQLLQYNHYHISTLLQVSEIAKQERDHATSGDLLERALFSFGRAVHSTFSANLAQGKARLDFRRPENREFWLASCRYISNLGMRSTWRTVYEWAKLLFSLDPENDPYCMSLVLDQYAIRGRQPQNFLDLTNTPPYASRWKTLPNVQISRALALVNLGQTAKGKQALYTAIGRAPWVIARLFRELNLDPPPGVWGKIPRTDSEKLHSEIYATRAKDIWNTPEASALLVEVSSALSSEMPEPPVIDREITMDESRHVLMTDAPPLIALLPRAITAQITSSSDPLPPLDEVRSYVPTSSSATARHMQTRPDAAGARIGPTGENLRELQGLYRFFAELFPWFDPHGRAEDQAEPDVQPSEEEIERRIAESGVSEEVIVQRTQRLIELQAGLVMGQEGPDAETPVEEAEEADA